MLLFVILEGATAIYSAAYVWYCVKNKRALGAAGAALLCALAAAIGILLLLYVV